MAHWVGLFLWSNKTPPKRPFAQGPRVRRRGRRRPQCCATMRQPSSVPVLIARDPRCQKPVATIPALAAAARSTSTAASKRTGRPSSRPPLPSASRCRRTRPTKLLSKRTTRPSCCNLRPRGSEAQALDAASNAVIDLVRAGRLDEAEQAARELLVRYPQVHDGYDRLGMVHEARGQFRQAADCYRSVVEFARANPENYDCRIRRQLPRSHRQARSLRGRGATRGQQRRQIWLTKLIGRPTPAPLRSGQG